MIIPIEGSWFTFALLTGISLAVAIAMFLLSRYFYLRTAVTRPFSILDLQLAASQIEIDRMIFNIRQLRNGRSITVLRNLRWHLLIDFLFMFAFYGALFAGCMLFAAKAQGFGRTGFAIIAWLQILALLSDTGENIFILNRIGKRITPPPSLVTKRNFTFYQWCVSIKWLIVILGVAALLSAFGFYWISGHYSGDGLKAAVLILLEIAIYICICFLLKNRGKSFGNTC